MRLAAVILAAVAAALAAPALADPAAEAAKAYTVEATAPPASAEGGRGRHAPHRHQAVAEGPRAPRGAAQGDACASTPGLTLAKAKLGRGDLKDPKAEAPIFEAAFTGAAAGKQQATATLDFFICSDAWCVKQVREIKLDVEVK